MGAQMYVAVSHSARSDMFKNKETHGAFLFFCATDCLVTSLYALSTITTMCISTRAREWSIAAAAQRLLARCDTAGQHMINSMSDIERQSHHYFVSYVTRNEMGVQLCGLLVTFK